MTKMNFYRVEVEMAPAVDLFYWEKYIPEQRAFRDRVRSELQHAFKSSSYKGEIRLAPPKTRAADYGDCFNVCATKRAAKVIKQKVSGILHVKKEEKK